METLHAATMKYAAKQFKSYYVVWKQEFRIDVGGNNVSLNRTMQYGNDVSLYLKTKTK